MLVGRRQGDASLGRAFDEPELDQVRLVNLLDRLGFLADGDRKGVDPHGAAAELVDDRGDDGLVHVVKADLVDAVQSQGGVGDLAGDGAVGLDLGVFAHAAQEAVGDARRAARPARDLVCAAVVDGGREDPRGTPKAK